MRAAEHTGRQIESRAHASLPPHLHLAGTSGVVAESDPPRPELRTNHAAVLLLPLLEPTRRRLSNRPFADQENGFIISHHGGVRHADWPWSVSTPCHETILVRVSINDWSLVMSVVVRCDE